MSHTDIVVLLGGDDVSNLQVQSLRQNGDLVSGLQGLDCSEEQNQHLDLCKSVPFFPTFCSREQGTCTMGLRETREDLHIDSIRRDIRRA